jgi:hypothetical protein
VGKNLCYKTHYKRVWPPISSSDSLFGCKPLCATRSSETDAIRQRGMEGKGQGAEDSHGLSVAKNLDNCASIQVR